MKQYPKVIIWTCKCGEVFNSKLQFRRKRCSNCGRYMDRLSRKQTKTLRRHVSDFKQRSTAVYNG